MKANILIEVTTCMIAILFLNGSQAQQSVNKFEASSRLLIMPGLFVSDFNKNSFPGAHRSEFNTTAVRNFAQRFQLAENVHWYKAANRLVVYFTENAIKNQSVYNSDGNWLYNIRSYPEEYLPAEVSTQVKAAFRGFSITGINEIKNNSNISYLVHMQDKTRWRNILVCDGETEVVEELLKYPKNAE